MLILTITAVACTGCAAPSRPCPGSCREHQHYRLAVVRLGVIAEALPTTESHLDALRQEKRKIENSDMQVGGMVLHYLSSERATLKAIFGEAAAVARLVAKEKGIDILLIVDAGYPEIWGVHEVVPGTVIPFDIERDITWEVLEYLKRTNEGR